METIPESHKDLLKDETKAICFLATVMKDGSPQLTPVWFNTDGEFILINTAEGRIKDKNMRTRPQVALTIVDPTDFYRYLQIRGKVVEFTREGAVEHIDRLSFKYRGTLKYANMRPGMQRIIYKIKPEKIDAH